MLASGVIFSLALQMVPTASSAEMQNDSNFKLQRQEQMVTAPSPDDSDDSLADLFIGTGEVGASQAVKPSSVIKRSVQPTYESWDVLRQYPRYDAQPASPAPEPKQSSPKDETKEKDDVQRGTD